MMLRILFLPMMSALLILNASVASAQVASVTALAERYPQGSIGSIEIANQALGEVSTAREQVEQEYQNERAACFDRFLMSACMNEAKEHRRTARAAIRQVEVEANAFLRKDRAAARDRALAEREIRSDRSRSIPISGASREGNAPAGDSRP